MVSALTLGVARTGPPPELRIDGPGGAQHLLIAGTTGGGKGSWVRSVLGAAAVRPDVQIAMIDAKAIESAPWAPRLLSRAVTRQQIAELSVWLEHLIERRTHEAAERGWDEWQPTPEEPTVLLMVDELAQAMKVPLFRETLDTALHMSRALGIPIVGATQQANAKALGSTEDRSLFTCRAALYDSEAAGYVFTYGKDIVSANQHVFGWLRADRPGLGVWTDGTREPRLARAYHWQRSDIAEVVAATKHLAMPMRAVHDLGAVAA